jgi:hypothetical protein
MIINYLSVVITYIKITKVLLFNLTIKIISSVKFQTTEFKMILKLIK